MHAVSLSQITRPETLSPALWTSFPFLIQSSEVSRSPQHHGQLSAPELPSPRRIESSLSTSTCPECLQSAFSGTGYHYQCYCLTLHVFFLQLEAALPTPPITIMSPEWSKPAWAPPHLFITLRPATIVACQRYALCCSNSFTQLFNLNGQPQRKRFKIAANLF